jgi:hypothetical protein
MSAKMREIVTLFLSLPLAACASVSVIPLDYDGHPKTDEAPGMRYYMPKPYLLVTQIPHDQWPPSKPEPVVGAGGGGGGGGGGGNGSSDKTPSDQTKSATASPSPSSDLSYQLGNNTYSLKLIYLPDMSKTMAINIVPGIFGTSSAQPTLQDGWMLTSMQASSDNTKALDSLTTLATALMGGGGGGGGTKSTTPKVGATANGGVTDPSLPPGLYEFRYDEYGHLVGLCAVSLFTNVWPSPRHPNYGPIHNTGFCPSLDALAAMNWVKVKG